MVVAGHNRRAHIDIGTGVMIGASALLRVGMAWAGLNYNPWSRSVAPLELIHFLLGVASCRLYTRTRNWRIPAPFQVVVTLGVWALTAGFAALSAALGLSAMRESWLCWVYFTSLTLALPLVLRATMASRWDSAIESQPCSCCRRPW